MLYDKYKDESEFRNKFVRALLTRLGFVAVAELHGTQEFGKDFVFSELTPFGFLRHYAAVVKHEKAIRQSSHVACETILSQIRQAFTVPFRLPDSEALQRVGSVFVFNSGTITENARIWIRDELGEERYGRNVHVLDGERLFQIDLTSAFRQGEQLIPKLQGLLNDLQSNLNVWDSISKHLPSFPEGRGSFTSALEAFMAAPFLTDRIPINEVVTLIQECRIIDRINQRYMMPFAPQGERRDQETETLKRMLEKSSKRASVLHATIVNALSTFRLLSNC